MIKRILMVLGLALVAGASEAQAGGQQATFEVGYSTVAFKGVICTTGTAINITTDTYKPAGIVGKFAGPPTQREPRRGASSP